MFFEITEPESTYTNVGIDFGTTNSLIAIIQNGKCVIIPGADDSQFLLPSVVYYMGPGAHPLVGEEALGRVGAISSIKSTLGCDSIIDGRTNIQIASDIFSALRLRALQFLSAEQIAAVITVPAYFDDIARNAVKTAAQRAGINVLRLINEPTSAAYAYGAAEYNKGLIMVYDFGGGTFDASILRIQPGVCEVIATKGDNHLGGDDLDACIRARYPDFDARKIKEHLSTDTIWEDKERNFSISREELWQLFTPYLDRTIDIVDDVVEQAGILASDIDQVLMVGGSSLIPAVRDRLEQKFAKVLLSHDPQQIVVRGAALKAHELSDGGGGLLIDVTPLSLGIELLDGLNEIIIPRNTPIPASHSHIFTSAKDGQRGFIIKVLQGESHYSEKCRPLATFKLQDLPLLPAGKMRLNVIFEIDANGILSVSATELTTGKQQKITIQPSGDLSSEEINKLLNT